MFRSSNNNQDRESTPLIPPSPASGDNKSTPSKYYFLNRGTATSSAEEKNNDDRGEVFEAAPEGTSEDEFAPRVLSTLVSSTICSACRTVFVQPMIIIIRTGCRTIAERAVVLLIRFLTHLPNYTHRFVIPHKRAPPHPNPAANAIISAREAVACWAGYLVEAARHLLLPTRPTVKSGH